MKNTFLKNKILEQNNLLLNIVRASVSLENLIQNIRQ